MDLRDISPELVLVDPELAPLARLLLPEPGAFRQGAPRPPALPETVRAVPRMEPPAARARTRTTKKPLLLLVAVSLTMNVAFIRHAQSSAPRPSLSPNIRCPRAGCDSRGLQPIPSGLRSLTSSSPRVPTLSPHAPDRVHHQESRSQSRVGDTTRRRAKPRAAVSKRSARYVIAPHRVVPHRTQPIVRWNTARGATYYDLVLWRHGKRVLDLWPASPHAVVPES